MNIIDKLKKENIHVNIRYYGLEDLSTGIMVKNFLDGKNTILNIYTNTDILTIDEYINYVFLDFVMKFEEVVQVVKKEKKEEFGEFIANCKVIYTKYTIGNLVKYIKNNYKQIYNYKDKNPNTYIAHDLKDYTSEFIADHFNCFDDEQINYVIKEATYDVIDCFEKWQKYFIKNPIKLKKLLNKENINKVFFMRTQELTEIIESLNNNDKFNETVQKAIDIIYDILKEQYFNPADDKEIWQSFYMLNDCIPFFRKVKSPHTYELEQELEKQEILFNESLLKNGHKQTIEYDLKPFKIFFEDNTKPWEVRIVFLTHSKNDNGKIISFLEQGAKSDIKALSDKIARKNPGTDEYFTSWRLRNLSCYLFEVKAKFMALMESSNNISEYLSDIYGELNYICDKINTTMEQESLDENMEMLSQFLTDLFINYPKNKEKYMMSTKNTIYGCAIFLCGLIEKILRIIYKNSMKDISVLPKVSGRISKRWN